MKITYLFLMMFIMLSACSNQAVYDNVQRNNRLACESVPSAQYEECIRQANKSYDEYEREREALLEAK